MYVVSSLKSEISNKAEEVEGTDVKRSGEVGQREKRKCYREERESGKEAVRM